VGLPGLIRKNKREILVAIILLILGFFLLIVFNSVPEQRVVLDSTAGQIIDSGVEKTGSPNLVTAILYDYRAFDSLGESTVIYAAVSSIALILSFKTLPISSQGLSFISKRTFSLVTPFVFIFGFYIITHGHLSPGGGFQGGVILAAISIIFCIIYGSAYDYENVSPGSKTLLETGGALLFVFLGILGIIVGGNFFSNFGISPAQSGTLFSSGNILLINLGIGVKVGAGLAIIFYTMIQKTYLEE